MSYKSELIKENVVALLAVFFLHFLALKLIWPESGCKIKYKSGGLDHGGSSVVSVRFLTVNEGYLKNDEDSSPLNSDGNGFRMGVAEDAFNEPVARESDFNYVATNLQLTEHDNSGVNDEVVLQPASHDSSSLEFSEGRTPYPGKDDLLSEYLSVVSSEIQKNWSYEGPRGGCRLIISQNAGGKVQGAATADCDLPADARRSLEAAVLMAQPLPYTGFESVFSEEISIQLQEF